MSDICGLIIVGNSGVGKSFLANIIVNKPHFKHGFSARSITHRTESIMCVLGDKYYIIYNIPGLIEGDEERIALNKQEINRAFEEQKDNPLIVIYVFGHQNGRIRNEDIITFQTIDKTYPFHSDSLIIIINGLPPDRPSTYNKDTQTTLINLLGMTPGEICFIDQLNSIDTENITVREQLIDAILNLHPRIHHKINDTNLTIQDISKLKMDFDMICIQINTERQEHEDIIRNMEQENEAMKCLSALKRLFFQAKIDLHRLITFSKHQEYLMSIIEQCKAHSEDDSTSNQTVKNTEKELSENLHTQRYVEAALDVHRRDIEQICYELEQIYDGKFDQKYESIREYYILLDDLRFDHTMNNIKHSFINDLYTFTYLRFGNIE